MDRRLFNRYLLFSALSSIPLFAEEQDYSELIDSTLNKKIIYNDINKSLPLNKICPVNIENINKYNGIKKYYLTVDDGYFHQKDILDIANEKNVKLNLFIIGKIIEQDPKIWISAIEQGHLLGSHTYNHYEFSKHSYKEIKHDFDTYSRRMKQKLGEENFSHIKYFRFPYGDIGNKSNRGDIHKLITQDYEWKVVGWDLDLSFKHESKHCSSFTLEEQIETYLSYNHQTQKDKNIVLFHFKKPDNDCLSDFINFGLNNDCKFLRLDQN